MSFNVVNQSTGEAVKAAGNVDTATTETIQAQLTANNTPFRFGYDSTSQKYGYILNQGGADTVIPFKDCDSSEITVTAANQILSGYKDYDSNGNLITGTNAGYDAGVTQGEANMKSGVTVTGASQVISGYKARTSDGTLVTGTDAGYSAGVTQGHADRDSGVTVTAASQVISGYKARTSNGTLVTGTDAGYTSGYNAGVTQGHADRDSGVTVTDPYHILSGYKGRKSNGELVTGTNGGWDAGRNQGRADRDSGVTVTAANQIVSGYKARNSSGTLLTGTATTKPTFSTQTITIPVPSSGQDRWKTLTGSFSFANECLGIIECKNQDGTHNECLQSVKLSGTKNNTCTIVMDTVYSPTGWNWSVTAKGY